MKQIFTNGKISTFSIQITNRYLPVLFCLTLILFLAPAKSWSLGNGTGPVSLKEIPKAKLQLNSCKKLDRKIYPRFDSWWLDNNECDPNFRNKNQQHVVALAQATQRYVTGVDKVQDSKTSQQMLKELESMAEMNLSLELAQIQKAKECLQSSQSKCSDVGKAYLDQIRSAVKSNWDKMKEGLALGFRRANFLSTGLTNSSNLESLTKTSEISSKFKVEPKLTHSFDSFVGRMTSDNSYQTMEVSASENSKYKKQMQRELQIINIEFDLYCASDFDEKSISDKQLLEEAKQNIANENQSPCPTVLGLGGKKPKKELDNNVTNFQKMEKLKSRTAKKYSQQYFESMAKAPVMAFISPKNPEQVSDAELLSGLNQIEKQAETTRINTKNDPLLLAKYIPLLERMTELNPDYCDFAEGFLIKSGHEEMMKQAGMVGLGVASAVPCFFAGGPIGAVACFAGGSAATAYGISEAIDERRRTEARSFATSVDAKFIKDFSEMNDADKAMAIEAALAPTGFGGAKQAMKSLIPQATAKASAKAAADEVLETAASLGGKADAEIGTAAKPIDAVIPSSASKEAVSALKLPNGRSIQAITRTNRGIEDGAQADTINAIQDYLDQVPDDFRNAARIKLAEDLMRQKGLLKPGDSMPSPDSINIAHEIGTSEGRVMKIGEVPDNALTQEDLIQKRRLLTEAGYNPEQIDFLMRMGLTGGRGSTEVSKTAKEAGWNLAQSLATNRQLQRIGSDGTFKPQHMQDLYLTVTNHADYANQIKSLGSKEIGKKHDILYNTKDRRKLNQPQKEALQKALQLKRDFVERTTREAAPENYSRALDQTVKRLGISPRIIEKATDPEKGRVTSAKLNELVKQRFITFEQAEELLAIGNPRYTARLENQVRQVLEPQFAPAKKGFFGTAPPDRRHTRETNQLVDAVVHAMDDKWERQMATNFDVNSVRMRATEDAVEMLGGRPTEQLRQAAQREETRRPAVPQATREEFASESAASELGTSKPSAFQARTTRSSSGGPMQRTSTAEEQKANSEVGMYHPMFPKRILSDNKAFEAVPGYETLADVNFLKDIASNGKTPTRQGLKNLDDAYKDFTETAKMAQLKGPNGERPPLYSDLFKNQPGDASDFTVQAARVARLGASPETIKKVMDRALLTYTRHEKNPRSAVKSWEELSKMLNKNLTAASDQMLKFPTEPLANFNYYQALRNQVSAKLELARAKYAANPSLRLQVTSNSWTAVLSGDEKKQLAENIKLLRQLQVSIANRFTGELSKIVKDSLSELNDPVVAQLEQEVGTISGSASK